MRKFGAVLVIAGALGWAGAAQASLIGDTVQVSILGPTEGATYRGPVDLVVGAGSELNCPSPNSLCEFMPFELDFAADSVTFRSGLNAYLSEQSHFAFSFTDLDFSDGGLISSVVLDTNLAGLDQSNVSFGDDFITVAISGVTFSTEGYFSLNIETQQQQPNEISSPAALGFLGLGLLGLGLGRRRALRGRK